MLLKDLITELLKYPQDIEVLVKEVERVVYDDDGDVSDEVFLFEKPSLPEIKYIYKSTTPLDKNEVIHCITADLFKEKFNILYYYGVDYYNRRIALAKDEIENIEQNDDLTVGGKTTQISYQNKLIEHYKERLDYLSSIECKTKIEERFSKTRQVLVLECE